MTIAIVSPTPGVVAGGVGGFSIDPATAAQTPIVVDITTTTHELVQMACPGFGVDERIVCRDGVFQGYWGQRSTKSTISGGYRLSILPPKGWSPNVLSKLAVAVDTTAAGGNIAPVANFTYVLGANRTIQFSNTSTDADGTVASWSWTFGDSGTSTLQNPSHAYADGGSYSVGLTVVDNLGASSATTTKTVYVWTVDATATTEAFPKSLGDWNGIFAASGVSTTLVPTNAWDFTAFASPSTGPIADYIGTRPLTITGGSIWNWQVAVPAHSFGSMKTTNSNQFVAKNATTPDLASASGAMLCIMRCAGVGDGLNPRTLMRMGASFDDDITMEIDRNNPAHLLIGSGNGLGAGTPRTSGTANVGGSVRRFVLQSNFTGSSVNAYTDQERINAGPPAVASGPGVTFGGDNGSTWYPDTTDYMIGAFFQGAAAEMSSTQWKAILSTMGAVAIPWS